MTALVQRFPINRKGTDYVVGDIHGEVQTLREGLARLSFNNERDRLFSVGDLIDRGPDSAAMLEWLGYPWFHPVLGNHEDMALQAAHDREQLLWWVSVNGGGWWLVQPEARREQFLAAFRRLPLAIEVQTQQGTVGIVHGDVPAGMSWQRFTAELEAGNSDVRHYCLWGRARARGEVRKGVAGVSRAFVGHTPVGGVVEVGNTYMIDTGACYGGHLTILPLITPAPSNDRPRRQPTSVADEY